jgi:hypothetical protein
MMGGQAGNAPGATALLKREVGTIVSAEREKEGKLMEQTTLGQRQQAQVPPGPLTQTPHTQGHENLGQHGQALEPDVQAHLGRQLRAVYDEMASQPVPDRFIQLLDALERKSTRTSDTMAAKTPTKVGGA